MSRFTGSLRVPGQAASVVRVVLSLEEERLILHAGDRKIGEWSLAEADVALDEDGVRLRVDDEELFVVVSDRDRFVRTLQGTRATDRRPRRPARPRPWGRVALGAGALVALALVIPGILVAVLMVGGGLLVLTGMAAAGDEYLASRLPDALSVPRLLGWGTAAVLVAVSVTVLT